MERGRALTLRPAAEVGAGDAGHLRRLNLQRVLAVVMSQPSPFTRAELIEATGLSAPTVGSLVAHLVRSGVVRDLGAGPSRGGRRPACMEFNARHGFVAGIDLGPTRTRLAVADLRGERLAHDVIPTPAAPDPAAMLSRVADALRGLLREAQAPPERLFAVAAGAPGAVDRSQGTRSRCATSSSARWGPRWSSRTTSTWPSSASTGGGPPAGTTRARSSSSAPASARAS